jgi:uncharacterized protein YecA (UPF0149 family)
MFVKSKVLKDGERAEAVVIDSDMSGYSNSKGINKWKLKLRVRFEDGSTIETKCSAYPAGPVGAFTVGEIVPVRYSAKDRTEIEVDRDAMVAAKTAGRAEMREKMIRFSEEKLERGES